jgi:hypothetical protein
MILYESAGMELGSLEVHGLMDQLMLHSVLYKMARHTHTTSPSLVKEELSYIMLTSHG